MRTLHDVIQWVEENGPPHAMNRIRLRLLSRTLKARVDLDNVDEETEVSPDYLDAFKRAAIEIVGKPLPVDTTGPTGASH